MVTQVAEEAEVEFERLLAGAAADRVDRVLGLRQIQSAILDSEEQRWWGGASAAGPAQAGDDRIVGVEDEPGPSAPDDIRSQDSARASSSPYPSSRSRKRLPSTIAPGESSAATIGNHASSTSKTPISPGSSRRAVATPAGMFAPARLWVTVRPSSRRIAAIIDAVVVFPLVPETRTQRCGNRRRGPAARRGVTESDFAGGVGRAAAACRDSRRASSARARTPIGRSAGADGGTSSEGPIRWAMSERAMTRSSNGGNPHARRSNRSRSSEFICGGDLRR